MIVCRVQEEKASRPIMSSYDGDDDDDDECMHYLTGFYVYFEIKLFNSFFISIANPTFNCLIFVYNSNGSFINHIITEHIRIYLLRYSGTNVVL